MRARATATLPFASALSLFGLAGPPEHGFSEEVWVETLVSSLERPASSEARAAVLDALAPHAAHPSLRAATGRLLSIAEQTPDHELAGAALRLLGERGAPVEHETQDRLLRLVHPHWRCMGYAPHGALEPSSEVGCGAPGHLTAPTPAGRVAGWAAWAAARVGPDRAAVAKVLTLLLLSFDDFTRAAAVDGLVALGAPGLDLLEHALLRVEDAGVQLRLMQAWGRTFEVGDARRRPSPEVLEVLRSRARATRRGHARRALQRLRLRLEPGPHRVVAEMIADLEGRGASLVLRDLATVGATASAALPAVLDALDTPDSQYAASAALEHIVPEGARPWVAAAVAARLDGDRAYPLIRVLERLGPPGRRALERALRAGPTTLRRTVAGMRSEASERGATAHPPVFDSPAWQLALRDRLMEDPDPGVRAAAARALRPPHSCDALLARAGHETAPEAFAGLAAGLAACGAPAAPLLLDWANADDPVGSAARRALVPKDGPRPPAPVQDVLTVLLGPADVKPRPRFMRAPRMGDTRLAARLGADAVPHLVARLEAEAPRVRQEAAYVLGQIGAPARSAAPALAGRLDDPDEDVRHWAAWSLGRLGDARVAPDLVSATTDPRPSVRRAAAEALGRIGAGVTDLRLALEADDPIVVEATLKGLSKADSVPRALFEPLARRLEHEDPDVARFAARAFVRLAHATPEVQARLRALLNAPRARTRWAAAEALLQVGEPEDIVPALRVRRAAPKAAQREDRAAMRRLDRMLKR